MFDGQPQRGMPRNSAPRPAGASDDDSFSDDDYEFSGNPAERRKGSGGRYNSGSAGLGKERVSIVNGTGDEEDWEQTTTSNRLPTAPSKMSEVETWGRSPTEAMRLACVRGNLEKLKQLFSNGCNHGVNQIFGGTEETPLITSCCNGHPELVEYLLSEQSADPNYRHTTAKITPLMSVVGCSNDRDEDTLLKCATALGKSGANMDSQDRFGMTALMIAVNRGQCRLAKFLIENGADTNIENPDGHTALCFAAMNGDGRMCRLLMEHGADIQFVDKTGFSPAELAQEKGFYRLSDMLYFARNTKWKPGLKPDLMEQLDTDAIQKRKVAADSSLVKEESSIDMLLSAVDGAHYLENFQRHKISYVQFLKLDDEELKEIGIEEVGIRGKILDHIKHIHNVQWQSSSLKKMAFNKTVTASEAVCIVINIKEHLEHISGSLQYLRKRIKDKPLSLQYDIERNKIEDLVKFCKQTEEKSNFVKEDLFELAKLLRSIEGYVEFQTAGKLPARSFGSKKKKSKSSESGICQITVVGAGILILGFLQWRWDVFGGSNKIWRWR